MTNLPIHWQERGWPALTEKRRPKRNAEKPQRDEHRKGVLAALSCYAAMGACLRGFCDLSGAFCAGRQHGGILCIAGKRRLSLTLTLVTVTSSLLFAVIRFMTSVSPRKIAGMGLGRPTLRRRCNPCRFPSRVFLFRGTGNYGTGVRTLERGAVPAGGQASPFARSTSLAAGEPGSTSNRRRLLCA